jgi:hypothetical protein
MSLAAGQRTQSTRQLRPAQLSQTLDDNELYSDTNHDAPGGPYAYPVDLRRRHFGAIDLQSLIGKEPSQATMTLAEEGEAWRVTFNAGGIPNGAATAADCELEALGSQDLDGVISARVVPFDGELSSVSAADIAGDNSSIEVSVGPEGAFVTDSGASARYCGLGSHIDGFYQRADTGY